MTELSTHGAWLRTTKPFEEGTIVEVTLALEGAVERRLRAEVMWIETRGKSAGMALEWLDVDTATRQWIHLAASGYPAVGGAPSAFEYADAV